LNDQSPPGRPFDPEAPRSERGQVASQISREIVRLHARLYGRGPTKARTYLQPDYALCILEDVFTTAEKTLARAGKGEQVSATRAAFQDAVREQFVTLVEEATGREVRALISQVHVGEEIAMELFLFSRDPQAAPAKPDMDGDGAGPSNNDGDGAGQSNG
jgi:uncharacterized protein YbcI